MRNGTITRFDAGDGLGAIQLDDGTEVRFGLGACVDFRASHPAAGMAVQVDDLKPGFGGRLRAGRVTPAGETWDSQRAVFGLESPVTVDDGFGKRVRLSPLDLDAFVSRQPTWTDRDDLSAHALGRRLATVPSGPPDLHGVFAPFRAQILETAVGVSVLRLADGEPAVGSSFLGGDVADIGDLEWPSHEGQSMLHLAQLGIDVIGAFGIEEQLNVFLSSLDGDRATAKVVATRRPERRKGARGALPVRRLEVERDAPAFPSALTLARVERGAARELLQFLIAARERTPVPATSVQFSYERSFACVDSLGEALVVGGYGETLVTEKLETAPYRRLLTIETRRFPALARLRRPREGTGTVLAIDYEPTTKRSWLH